jgi:diguanylate cyclase (GGDEF)-like protein/PAS domain S-box-containing protein
MSDPQEVPAGTAAAVALQQSEARLRLMIDAVPAMITYLDTEERYLFCNRPYLEMLGKSAEQVVGHKLKDVLGDALHDKLRPWREQVLAGELAQYERQHQRPDGRVCDLSVTFVPHLDGQGRVAGFFSLTLDITELKTLERKLAHTAQHDTLTGLPNRALYDDRLAQAVERNKRHRQPFALVYLDVDHFKLINDTHGHAVGDQLLRAFAGRVRQCIRGVDTAARIGGDEFALILEGPIAAEHAAAVAQKIVAAMRQTFDLDGAAVAISTSIGIAIAGDPAVSATALAASADAALYEAKAQGRNTYVLHP